MNTKLTATLNVDSEALIDEMFVKVHCEECDFDISTHRMMVLKDAVLGHQARTGHEDFGTNVSLGGKSLGDVVDVEVE